MYVPIITPTPSSQSLTPHPPEIVTNGRDASFSSYSAGAEENFMILKLGSKSTPNDHIFLGKPKSEDRELDIFDEEKYFNAPNHSPKVVVKNPSAHNQPIKDETIEMFATNEQSIDKATLSIHSESSSSNSRSSLLHTLPRNQQPPKKANKKSFLATMIGCNSCSCANQNSLNITGVNKSNKGNKGDDHLVGKSRPGYGSVKFDEPEPEGNRTAKMKNQVEENITTKRSKSLQVLGSPVPEIEKMCPDLEHRLTMMTWERIVVPGILAAEEIKIPSISSEMLNDTDSDASSDLFEIEGFSKVDNDYFLSRQTSDGGCRSPTTCYAPSEPST